MLIDDQEDLLKAVGLMLKELGHEYISWVDSKIALNVIGNPALEIDLVITDYSMLGFPVWISGRPVLNTGLMPR